MKTTLKYDHYEKYDELEKNLKHFAEKYPQLTDLQVNTVTPEGRNQYVMTLTNKKTGSALSKPALYIDGNIHAGEVTSTECAMCTIDVLLTNYGSDPKITWLLDHHTFYVIPRVSPDGSEKYLTTPYSLRSAPRPYETKKGGIQKEDLDGDGVIRMMRIPTPYGAWKKDPDLDGAMKLREPDDIDGEFYDIYPEGILENFDGDENLKAKKDDWGLDFNRNFPFGWFPEARQPGAGDYPLSNPETRGLVEFALAHPNIGGAAIGHTSGGIILYPPGTRHASTAPSGDMEKLKAIAAMGQKELGYTPINIFDSFMKDQEHYDSGALDDWFYQSQGIPAYTMEFWNVGEKAGIPYDWKKHEEETPAQKVERFNTVAAWVVKNAPEYFSGWKEYDHPQLGKVEIGGLQFKFTVQNPPEKFLAAECLHDAAFNIRFASALPEIEVADFKAESCGNDFYKVTALIGNRGYLPTNLSEEAVHLKKAHGLKVQLEGAEIIEGKPETDIEDLDGFSGTKTGMFYGNLTTFSDAKAKKKLTWIIKAEPGTKLEIHVSGDKCGKADSSLTL